MQQVVLVIDALIALLFVEALYTGFKRGIIGSLIPFATLLLSFILLDPLCNVVEPYISPTLENAITCAASTSISVAKEKVSISKDMPEGVVKEITAKTEDTIENIANSSVSHVSNQIIRFVVLIISSFLLRLILHLIFGGFETIGHMPVIASVNRLGGIAVAVIGRYIEMCLILILITLIGNAIPAVNGVYEVLMMSKFIKVIVKYNIINTFI